MDEARRRELHARRAAILAEKARLDRIAAWEEMVRRTPILTALEASGDSYHSDNYGGLTGPLNHWAWNEYSYPFRYLGESDLPEDPVERDAAILAMLRERVGPAEEVTIVLAREHMMLRLTMPVLARHFRVLADNGEGGNLGFAAPPDDWILVVRQRGEEYRHVIETGQLVDSFEQRSR